MKTILFPFWSSACWARSSARCWPSPPRSSMWRSTRGRRLCARPGRRQLRRLRLSRLRRLCQGRGGGGGPLQQVRGRRRCHGGQGGRDHGRLRRMRRRWWPSCPAPAARTWPEPRFNYTGPEDCRAAMLFGGKSNKMCTFACIGLGNCAKACQFDAMHIVDGVAKVDRSKCVGCGACVDACPKSIVKLIPESQKIMPACRNMDKGAQVMKICKVGCIGCMKCQRECPADAITRGQQPGPGGRVQVHPVRPLRRGLPAPYHQVFRQISRILRNPSPITGRGFHCT